MIRTSLRLESLGAIADTGLTPAALDQHIAAFVRNRLPRLERYWAYYRNPMRIASGPDDNRRGRWYRLAQEAGLPARTLGSRTDPRTAERREVVIENDIAWRVQAMIDFMFGKPVEIRSDARDPALRDTIERVLQAVWTASGGIALLQDLALLGHIYGHADLALRIDPALLTVGGSDEAIADGAARNLHIELIDPRRGIPLVDPHDYRRVIAYIVRHDSEPTAPAPSMLRRVLTAASVARSDGEATCEVIGPRAWAIVENGALAWEQSLNLTGGRVPIVHIQNIAIPLEYGGQGEVEPLIPLQDELNTRLSDRASRVTLQSFKMYLARGIHGFENARVGPGQIWTTDNPQATVQEFGGDANSPSEDAHIREVREALDKISGIPPLASGVVQAKIGNLSSANALRITLMAALSKTARKRVTYGGGISAMCELVLTALHNANVLLTDERDRRVRLVWRDPLPEDVREQMQAAESKARLGVPAEVILEELGYAPGEGARP
jgi:hypothetical protein